MTLINLTEEDFNSLPAGSTVEHRYSSTGEKIFATTKRIDGGWECSICPTPHSAKAVVRLGYEMNLEAPKVGDIIDEDQVKLTKFFPVGTHLQDRNKVGELVWKKTKGGWAYDYQDNPLESFGFPISFLNPLYAPYTVVFVPDTDTEPEKEDDTVMAYTDTEPEKEETVKTYPREEATKMTDKRLIDDRGGLWGYRDGFWYFGMSEKVLQDKIDGKQAGITWKSLPIGGSEFYTLAPEPEEDGDKFSATVASRMKGYVMSDKDGGRWEYLNDTWIHGDTHEMRVEDSKLDGGWKALSAEWEPYTVHEVSTTEPEEKTELPLLNEKGDAPEKTEFTAAEASRMRGVIFRDEEGDFWKNFDGYWKYISAEYPKYLHLWETPSRVLSSDHEPYTFLGYKDDDMAGENEVPRFKTHLEEFTYVATNTVSVETETQEETKPWDLPEYGFKAEGVQSVVDQFNEKVEKTPTITESLNKIAKSLERIANALEGK